MKRYALFSIFPSLCLTFNALAQPEISPELDSNQTIKAGARAFKLNEHAQAAALFAQAVVAYQKQGNAAGEVQANVALAQAMAKKGKVSKAIQILEKQTEIVQKDANLTYLALYIIEKTCILYTSEAQSMAKTNALAQAFRALTYAKGSSYYYYLGSLKNMEGLMTQATDSKKAIKSYTESIAAFQKSKEKNSNLKIGLVYNNMGALYEQQSDWLNAQNYYERAYGIAIKNKPNSSLIAMTLYNMAYPMEEQGKYEDALATYKKVLAAYAKTNKTEGRDEAEVYLAMSGCYLQLRNLVQTRLYAQRCLAISAQLSATDKAQTDFSSIGMANLVLAHTHENDAPKKALAYVAEAEKSVRASHNDFLLGDVLLTKSRIFSNFPAFGNADKVFAEAVALNTKLELPIIVARTQLNWAAYQQKTGQKNYADLLAAAKPVLIKAQKKANIAVLQALEWTLAPQSPQNTSLRLSAINNCLLPNAAIHKIGDPINPTAILRAEQYLEVVRILSAQSGGVEKLHLYENALQFLVFMRQNIQFETSKLNISLLTRQFTDAALREATAQNDAIAAFRCIEYAKSLSILEAQQRNESCQRANLTPEIIQKENTLKAQLFVLQKKLEEDNAENQTEIYAKITALNNELETFERNIKNEIAQKSAVLYMNNTQLHLQLQAALQPNEVFIDYYLNDKNLYAVLLEHKKMTILKNDIENANLNEQVQAFLQTTKQPDLTAFVNANIALRNTLFHFGTQHVERLVATKKRWIISPDDALFQVPFEILEDVGMQGISSEKNNFATFNYLIRQHSIVYQYSAALYLQSKNHEYSIFKRGLLAFAPFTDRNALANTNRSASLNQMFAALPFSKKEVENLYKNLSAKIFISEDATKQNFIQNASKYGVLHLATHTVYDSTDQEYNLVFLDKNKKSYSFLKNYEIAYSNLAAELVALSACNTANGTIQKGEAAASLARAFAYAGTPNVLTTLWEVPDQANASIIERFYKNLAQGLPKDEALQQAKLQYLATTNPTQTYPQMWAGAILIGNAEPLQALQKAWWQTWWWLLLLPFAASVFLLYTTQTPPYFRKRSNRRI